MMKKISTILCVFVLMLSLSGCAKLRDPNCYSVGQYNDGWSILYTDEDGVEEIAPLGSYEQPLALEKGRFYFVQDGKMVSVDAEGENRQEVEIAGLPSGARITFVDEANFYCLADRSGAKCWRVSKADANDHEEMDIPASFRPSYLHQLEAEVRAVTPAKDDRICVRGMRAVTDGNGSLLSLELELLCLDSENGFNLKTWRTCRTEMRFTLDGVETKYINENLTLSVADSTIQRMLALDDCLSALKDVELTQIIIAQPQGDPESFRLTYLADEYEACAKENRDTLTCLDIVGDAVDADTDALRFLLAQVGGCDVMLTDRDGTQCGNLLAIQLG